MDTLLLLFTAGLVVLSIQDEPPSDPRTDCRDVLVEHETLRCLCIPPDTEPPSDLSLSWNSHGQGDVLMKSNVSRLDNGTVFTCTMKWNGRIRTVDYTLKVAYGPEQVSISGPSKFLTNGSQVMTLTCKASGVYPEPIFRWGGEISCLRSNGNVCTLRPKAKDNGKTVACISTNKYNAGKPTFVNGNYTLPLQYPPQAHPVIRREGETIICAAVGGKPAVSAVNLSCSNETGDSSPERSLFPETTGVRDNEAYSSVFVNCTSVTDIFNLSCTCRSRWDPDERMYPLTARRSVLINCTDKGNCEDPTLRKQSTFLIFSFVTVVLVIASC